jgi:hypothetical protein
MGKINWGGLIRVLAPRIVGSAVALGTGWIATKTNGAVTLNPEQVSAMLVAYGLGHIGTAAVINPASAATPTLADAGKEAQKELTVTPEK